MKKHKRRLSKISTQKNIGLLIGLLVVLTIALIGVKLLISGSAISPYGTVEAGSGSITSPATIQSSTSIGKYVLFGSAGGGTVGFGSPVKPPLTGIIQTGTTIPSGYGSVVQGAIVEAPWSSLQSSLDGPITANNPIDQAIVTAQADNLRLFVDVQAGEYAPAWAKDLPVTTGTQGPFTICNDDGLSTTGTSITVCGTMPHWWETNYQNAYANLMSQLAAKYNDVPQVAMVGIDGCMTIFNEPLLRESTPTYNIPVYESAGLTAAGDEQCEKAQINAMQPWTHTDSYLSFNPYEQWVASSNTTGCSTTDLSPCGSFTTNEDFTESLMDYCRQELGQRCVLANESVGNDSGRIVPPSTYSCSEINTNSSTWESIGYYDRMYTKMRCMGGLISMRSATPTKLAREKLTLATTIPWAISYGASSFQPPDGFDKSNNTTLYLTPTQIQTFDTDMATNSSL